MKFPTDRPVKVVMLGAGGTGGYTLKLIPGTPEENAPVFDFENERILRPAA